MAAVRPAGPDPRMTTSRGLGHLSPPRRSGLRARPGEGAGRHQQRADQGVRRPHPAAEGVHVEQPDQGDGEQDAQDEGHDGDDDPEDEAPGHQHEGPDDAVVDGADHVLDGVGHLGGPFGLRVAPPRDPDRGPIRCPPAPGWPRRRRVDARRLSRAAAAGASSVGAWLSAWSSMGPRLVGGPTATAWSRVGYRCFVMKHTPTEPGPAWLPTTGPSSPITSSCSGRARVQQLEDLVEVRGHAVGDTEALEGPRLEGLVGQVLQRARAGCAAWTRPRPHRRAPRSPA